MSKESRSCLVGADTAPRSGPRPPQDLLEGQDRLPAPAGVAVRVIRQAEGAASALIERLHVVLLEAADAPLVGDGPLERSEDLPGLDDVRAILSVTKKRSIPKVYPARKGRRKNKG